MTPSPPTAGPAPSGGDGTIREAATGLIREKESSICETPLIVLPGGTANVFAIELGMPLSLEESCKVAISSSSKVKEIDVAKVHGQYFILRLGIGFEAGLVRGASRYMKDQFGSFAYALSGFFTLLENKTATATYKLNIDGKKFEYNGVTCIITNAGNIGFPGLSLSRGIEIDDGLLDVIIIQSGNVDLRAKDRLIKNITTTDKWLELVSPFVHLQGAKISIEVDPRQDVQCDGEPINPEELNIEVLHKAIRVITP